MQALAPISNPVEMGENIANVIAKLNENESYIKQFKDIYKTNRITGEQLLKSLAHFQVSLVSMNSKYDLMKRGVDVFTDQENRGYELFLNHCNSCHTEPLFTHGGFENNGLFNRLHLSRLWKNEGNSFC